jgi:hypothetical protein
MAACSRADIPADDPRTLSPSRARASTRSSRSSSFGSNAERRPPNLVLPEGTSRYLAVGGGSRANGAGDGTGDIGQGSLTLDHLAVNGNKSTTFVVQAPELLVAEPSPDMLYPPDDSDLRTPIPGGQDAYFATASSPSLSSTGRATRARSHTTSDITFASSGLSALAGFNLSPVPPLPQSLDPPASSSRPASRPASRSSSINSQQYPDSLGLRPPGSSSPSSSRMLKKARSAQGGIASALALSGVALASPSAHPRQPMDLIRTSTQRSLTRDSLEEVDSDSMSNYGENGLVSMDQLGDFDDVVSQLGTGYAVASSKRNAEFHAIFKNIPDDDYLIEGVFSWTLSPVVTDFASFG